ncbi:MAG TPA: DUF4190 domain-containing protein [Mycobacteriales bacterium]|nr:DUF4190 domain-containing protein [Mycobacteriales bacterium]
MVAFIPGPGSLAAIILGAIALSRISQSNGQQKGRGLAIAGLVLGSLFFVIAILAAIAIPTFLNQRLKGWDAETKTALRNAATAEESHYVDNRVYTDSVEVLIAEGFTPHPDVTVVVALSPDGSQYCIQGIHRNVSADHSEYADHVWYIGSTTATVSTNPDVACR